MFGHDSIQYYNRYISKAAAFLTPLNDMLRGNVKNSNKLSWSAKAEAAFIDSKALLVIGLSGFSVACRYFY